MLNKISNHKFVFGLLIILSASIALAAPSWWSARGVVPAQINQESEETIERNYEAINIGQLKFMAAVAAEELNKNLAFAGGAGTEINNMVSNFSLYIASDPDANYAVVNIGQLKTIAEPFYKRLHALTNGMVVFPETMVFQSGGTTASNHKFPWPAMPANPTEADYAPNYEVANVGQLKFLFGWSLNLVDSNDSGIPDYWKIYYYDTSYKYCYAYEDNDNDGLTNLQEYQNGTHPKNFDTDGDGISDWQEVQYGSDPLDPNSKPPYLAQPYFEDFESYQLGVFEKTSYMTNVNASVANIVGNFEGRQSKILELSFADDFRKTASQSFNFLHTTQDVVWVDFYMKVEKLEGSWRIPNEELKNVNFYFRTGKLYYTKHSNWHSINLPISGWHRFTIRKHYDHDSNWGGSQMWSLWIDGIRIIFNAPQNNAKRGLQEFKVYGKGGAAYIDNFYASHTQPADYGTFDDDNDGLTNAEETTLGTNPQSADTDADDINDQREIELGRDPKINDLMNIFSPNELKNGWDYLWTCDFSPSKGYHEGSLVGQNFWYSKSAIITDKESMELSLTEENGYAFAERSTFGENANKIWMGFDAILAPNDLPNPETLNRNGQVVIIAPDINGDIFCYNKTTSTWQNITPENFNKQIWHRYEISLDYTTGVAKIYIDAPETSEDERSELPSIDTLMPDSIITFDNTQGPKKFKKFKAHSLRDETSSPHISSADNNTHIDNLYVSTVRRANTTFPDLPDNITPIDPPSPPPPSGFIDTDLDGIDDRWELEYFGDLTTASATSDYNGDGLSDKQHYLNSLNGLEYNSPSHHPEINVIILTPLEK